MTRILTLAALLIGMTHAHAAEPPQQDVAEPPTHGVHTLHALLLYVRSRPLCDLSAEPN